MRGIYGGDSLLFGGGLLDRDIGNIINMIFVKNIQQDFFVITSHHRFGKSIHQELANSGVATQRGMAAVL